MRITVRSNDTRLRIPIPSALIFNDLTALLAPRFMAQNGVTITARQARRVIHALWRYKLRHRDWVLVEAQSGDGTYVEIRL